MEETKRDRKIITGRGSRGGRAQYIMGAVRLRESTLTALRELREALVSAGALDLTKETKEENECKIETRNQSGKKELYISGRIGGYSASTQKVSEWFAEQNGDVTLGLNSGGGDAWEGIAIHSIAANYDRGKVTTRIDGRAASAAGVIFLAGDDRQMMPTSRLMLHEASIFGFVEGNKRRIKTQMENILEAMDQVNGAIVDIIAQATGLDKNKAANLVTEDDKYFDANSALTKKLATTILQPRKKAETTDLAANRRFAAEILEGLFIGG